MWDKLKEKTHAKGIIAKLEALTSAIQNCITSSILASTTITEIKDALTSVFEGSAPTQEEWLVVLLLNTLMDREYDWLRKDLLGFMMNSKIQVSANDIVESIKMEHHEKKSCTNWRYCNDGQVQDLIQTQTQMLSVWKIRPH